MTSWQSNGCWGQGRTLPSRKPSSQGQLAHVNESDGKSR